jgi:Protein of unknown function (DUF3179)
MPANVRPAPGLKLIFWIFAFGTFALFFIPAFIIRPFRYQSPRALALAFEVKAIAPVATVVLALVSLLLGWILWSRTSQIQRVFLSLGILLAAGSAVMSRLNYFEWMFHPIQTPGFLSAQNAKLDPGEMIMAVRFGNDARAYPIVQMAYHHVFNDEVGGTPIVVTY